MRGFIRDRQRLLMRIKRKRRRERADPRHKKSPYRARRRYKLMLKALVRRIAREPCRKGRPSCRQSKMRVFCLVCQARELLGL
jgi:hypothetical protein